MSTILEKIKSVKLCLMAHPDNEKDSEFADRISDLEEIEGEILKKPIKIESKKDLPKERINCWFYDKNQGWIAGEFLNNGKEEMNFILANATHYLPIIKPDLPTI
jgi:hypothetical protein